MIARNLEADVLRSHFLPVHFVTFFPFRSTDLEICPEMHVNEIPHNRHHKVSPLTKFHQKTQNYIKYEVYENV